MKKLILSLAVTAFAIATFAGEGSACCAKETASCCKDPTAKAQCPMVKQGKATAKNTSTSAKQKLESPKAISIASR